MQTRLATGAAGCCATFWDDGGQPGNHLSHDAVRARAFGQSEVALGYSGAEPGGASAVCKAVWAWSIAAWAMAQQSCVTCRYDDQLRKLSSGAAERGRSEEERALPVVFY